MAVVINHLCGIQNIEAHTPNQILGTEGHYTLSLGGTGAGASVTTAGSWENEINIAYAAAGAEIIAFGTNNQRVKFFVAVCYMDKLQLFSIRFFPMFQHTSYLNVCGFRV